MKKIITFLLLVLPCVSFAQSEASIYDEQKTDSGKLVKYRDIETYYLPTEFSNQNIKISIRYLYNLNSIYCFFECSFTDMHFNSKTHKFWVNYKDLVEINKAIMRLLKEEQEDIALKPINLVNEYQTSCSFGLKFGYAIETDKRNTTTIKWYVDLDDTVLDVIPTSVNGKSMANTLLTIQQKIEELQRER